MTREQQIREQVSRLIDAGETVETLLGGGDADVQELVHGAATAGMAAALESVSEQGVGSALDFVMAGLVAGVMMGVAAERTQ